MKFRKSYIGALLISFAVFCGTGLIATVIAREIPSGPVAQQFKFLSENHYSPAAYSSYAYAQTAQRIGTLDVLITLFAMALAGLVLGIKMASRTRLPETIVYSVVSAIILAGIMLSIDWLVTLIVEKSLLESSGFGPSSTVDAHYLKVTAGTIALWTAVYTLGAVAGHTVRRRLAPPSVPAKGARPSKRRAASTIP